MNSGGLHRPPRPRAHANPGDPADPGCRAHLRLHGSGAGRGPRLGTRVERELPGLGAGTSPPRPPSGWEPWAGAGTQTRRRRARDGTRGCGRGSFRGDPASRKVAGNSDRPAGLCGPRSPFAPGFPAPGPGLPNLGEVGGRGMGRERERRSPLPSPPRAEGLPARLHPPTPGPGSDPYSPRLPRATTGGFSMGPSPPGKAGGAFISQGEAEAGRGQAATAPSCLVPAPASASAPSPPRRSGRAATPSSCSAPPRPGLPGAAVRTLRA